MERRFASLELWTRERYPGFGVRRVPLVGSGHGADRLHAVLGPQSGQPATSTFIPAIPARASPTAVAGSLTILPLILGEDSRYAPSARSRPEIVHQYLVALAVRATARSRRSKIWPSISVRPRSVSVDEIAPGEGAIMRSGTIKLACYKSETGISHPALGDLHACRVHGSLEPVREMLGLPLPRLAVRTRRTGPQRSGGQPAVGSMTACVTAGRRTDAGTMEPLIPASVSK